MKINHLPHLMFATALMFGGALAQADSGNQWHDGDEATSHHHWVEDSRDFHEHHRQNDSIGYDYGTTDTGVMYQGHWVGTMTGSWNDGPVRTWQGSYDNTANQPHWQGHYVEDAHVVGAGHDVHEGHDMSPRGWRHGYHEDESYRYEAHGYDNDAHGYGYPRGQIVYSEVLVPSEPIITKTVSTRTYYEYEAVRSHYVAHRAWHPVHHCVKPTRCVTGS